MSNTKGQLVLPALARADAAVTVALAKLRADRFPTAAAFAAALGNPAFGRAECTTGASGSPLSTPRRIAAIAGVAAVAVAPGVLLGRGTVRSAAGSPGIVVSAILPPARRVLQRPPFVRRAVTRWSALRIRLPLRAGRALPVDS